jgi:hypothetical protein
MDCKKNHGLIMVAAFEKTLVFVIGLLHFLTGGASLAVVLIVTGDLIFGILFIEDLFAIRKMAS